ncbi:MAG: T9SS type A sorting domain-containing protein [Bacteroidetes bacterium]|nr:T9SS type A sorting domain-containing protein [Bacteroidota bacterium]
MKKLLLILSVATFGIAHAQWKEISPMRDYLRDVTFINSTTGYAVGGDDNKQKGFVLKTTDGGNTWTIQTDVTDRTLNTVYFYNSSVGYVGGDNGRISKTVDGGATWTSCNYNTVQPITSIFFTSATTGVAVGWYGVIIKTTDGGNTWSASSTGTNANYTNVYFTDASTGFIAGSEFLKTTDGGATWTNMGLTVGGKKFYFVDKNTGYLAGYNPLSKTIIKKTTDGGTTWIETATPSMGDLNNVFFRDTNNGFVVGMGGVIYSTSNGGTTWVSKKSSTTTVDLYGVAMLDSGKALIVGDGQNLSNYLTYNLMMKTADTGKTWNRVLSGAATFKSVYFFDADNGFVISNDGSDAYDGYGTYNTLWHTTNGGTIWNIKTNVSKSLLNAVYFTSITTGFAVGKNGAILKTIDGGNTWVATSSGITTELSDVYFVNSQIGYISGGKKDMSYNNNDTCVILKTTDGGNTWIQQTCDTLFKLYSINFPTANAGYAAGDKGIIEKTTDGGTTWKNINKIGTSCMDIIFTSADTGYLVEGTSNTKIFYTTNGGNTWSSVYVGYTNSTYFVGIAALGKAAYAVGYRNDASGNLDSYAISSVFNFSNYNDIVYNSEQLKFHAVSVPAANRVYAVGDYQRIMMYDTTIVTGQKSEFENNAVTLFPNPSNGTFTLVLKNIHNEKSQIKIANVLGEMVYSSTINSDKSEIDLSSQPNGIYFLTIKTDSRRDGDPQGTANKKIIINK